MMDVCDSTEVASNDIYCLCKFQKQICFATVFIEKIEIYFHSIILNIMCRFLKRKRDPTWFKAIYSSLYLDLLIFKGSDEQCDC